MASYNPFAHMNEVPANPPFLARDTVPDSIIKRHQQRMAAHPTHPVQLENTSRSEVSINGKVAMGLAFDQQEALLAALTGDYAKNYWSDMWQSLYRRWGLGDVLDTILADGQAPASRVRKVLAPILLELNPDVDEEARALLFLYRAWQFRHQVMVERRAVNLVPVVGGDQMGHTVSFTPVFKRLSHDHWQLGWPGDSRPESPHSIRATDVAEALGQALPLFNRWYFEDQATISEANKMEARRVPDHIYLVPWGQRLRQDHELPMGSPPAEALLEELSHNHLFRLRLPDGRQYVLRGDPVSAVQQGLAANKPPLLPTPPTVSEMNRAYLAAMARRGEEAQMRLRPDAIDVRPFSELTPITAYVVSIEGRNVRQEITVTWVSGPRSALAVVCGGSHAARAVIILSDNRGKLGMAPVSYTTHKPDLARMWTTTQTVDLDWEKNEADRRVITAWAAWVWHEKALSYPPPSRSGNGK